MKSKISFFNKTIFWKNVTLYWPIWGLYTLLCFVFQPIMLWITNNMDYFYVGSEGYPDARQLRDLVDHLAFEPYVILIAFAALFSGMALYSYLYNNKSANMIHSMPVDRTQLYGTALISGWVFLIVPLFATALFSTLLCIIYTIPGIGYVWGWFLAATALALIAFSIVSICALFTGHIVVLPMYVVAVNLMSWIVYYLVYIVVTTFGYGVSSLGDGASSIAAMLCPVQCFYDNLQWSYQYAENREFVGASLEGLGLLILYTIIAIGFYVAAYVIYRKRKIEQAGDFLTVNWVKPIFRAIVGCIGAIFGAMLIREVLLEVRIGCGVPLFVVIMLVIGAICYFAADMFINKSFHVFKKKNWIGCSIFSVVLLAFFACMYGAAENYEKYMPKESEIETATVHLGYAVTLEGEEAAEILEIHGEILKELDWIERIIESGDRNHESVRISYQLKNGEDITRRYQLPEALTTIQPAVAKIVALEDNEENFLKHIFCEEYEDIKFFNGGYFEAPFVDEEGRTDENGYPDTVYDSIKLDAVQAKALYEAIIADVKAGTLMKYNVYRDWMNAEGQDMYYKYSETSISIDYHHPKAVEDLGIIITDEDETTIYYSESDYESYINSDGYMSAYVSFGPDCENIINKLIEMGIIESVEEIWWGEAEEMLK